MQKTEAIGEIFIRMGLITQDQLRQALEKQKLLKRQESLGDVLVSMGFITERDRVRCLGEQWGVPFIDLNELNEPEVDSSLLKLVPQNAARKLKVLPVAKKNGKLTLAMKNPLDIFAIDEVRMMSGMDVEPAIALEEDIINAIGRLYRSEASVTEQVEGVIKEFEEGDINLTAGDVSEDDEDVSIEHLRELSEEAPVIKLANLIISRGIQDGASDIHRTSKRYGAGSLEDRWYSSRGYADSEESPSIAYIQVQDIG